MPKPRKKKGRRKPRVERADELRKTRFVLEYLQDQNATHAAIRAGYSERTARQQGSDLLSRPDIRAAIERGFKARQKRVELTVDKVLEQQGDILAGALTDRDWAAANKANELLGRHIGMFGKKVDLGVSESLRQLVERAGNTDPAK